MRWSHARANPLDEVLGARLGVVQAVLDLASSICDPLLDHASIASQGTFAAALEAIELAPDACIAVRPDGICDPVASLENRPTGT
jgi:hypothetical protein